jgi:hypothetical protein
LRCIFLEIFDASLSVTTQASDAARPKEGVGNQAAGGFKVGRAVAIWRKVECTAAGKATGENWERRGKKPKVATPWLRQSARQLGAVIPIP